MKINKIIALWLAVLVAATSFFTYIPQASAQENTATLAVIGDSEKGIIVCPKSIEISEGETAYSLLSKELGDKVEVSKLGSFEYVSGIDGLRELDRGEQSGWLYETNGESPTVGANQYEVKEGDVIAYRYSLNWGEDLKDKTLEESIESLGGCEQAQPDPSNPDEDPGEQPTDPSVPKDGDTEQPPTYQITGEIKQTVDHILKKNDWSDWELFAVARSGNKIPDSVKKKHIEKTAEYVTSKDKNGRLFGTDLERAIFTVLSLEQDPTNFAGKNLIRMLYTDEKNQIGSINTAIYGLLAIDSKTYQLPENAKWTREKFIDNILNKQHNDGGWALSSSIDAQSEPDLTGMAMTALAPYKDKNEKVKTALAKAGDFLSSTQTDKGGYASLGQENSISAAQALIGIVLSGDDPTSEKYTKNGNNVIDAILSYRTGNGFKWIDSENGVNDMATEQVLNSLIQYQSVQDGKGSIYVWTKEQTPSETKPTPAPDKDSDQEQTPKPEQDPKPEKDPKPEPEQQPTDSSQKPAADNQNKSQAPADDSQNKEKAADSTEGHKLPNTSLYGWDLVVWFGSGLLLILLGFIIYRKTLHV
ncbi:DUF4430 domain-containing protein [Bacillus gobiensis]|uniref:DUF4430 domain-containing protein n=1 Tax=Bacillus gobiensis TaxID=1441095 RepID=UPI003D23192D